MYVAIPRLPLESTTELQIVSQKIIANHGRKDIMIYDRKIKIILPI